MAVLSDLAVRVAEEVWTEDEPTLAEYELTDRILVAAALAEARPRPAVPVQGDRLTDAEREKLHEVSHHREMGWDSTGLFAVVERILAARRAPQPDWQARALAAEAKVAAIAAALDAHPKVCDRYTEDDVVTCGWKRAVGSVQAALDA